MSNKIIVIPPNCLAALTHWKVITKLIENLPVRMVEHILKTNLSVYLGQQMMMPCNRFMYPTDQLFVDANCHLDIVTKKLLAKDWADAGLMHCNQWIGILMGMHSICLPARFSGMVEKLRKPWRMHLTWCSP